MSNITKAKCVGGPLDGQMTDVDGIEASAEGYNVTSLAFCGDGWDMEVKVAIHDSAQETFGPSAIDEWALSELQHALKLATRFAGRRG